MKWRRLGSNLSRRRHRVRNKFQIALRNHQPQTECQSAHKKGSDAILMLVCDRRYVASRRRARSESRLSLPYICLSHQKGESPLYRDFGTRFADYYGLFSGSPWFEQLLKLEVIRQAAIPHVDTINNRQHTPLECVERVFGIEVLADAPTKNWLPIRVDLDVKGVGRWKHELSVCIPQDPIRRPSLDKLLAGPIPTARSLTGNPS